MDEERRRKLEAIKKKMKAHVRDEEEARRIQASLPVLRDDADVIAIGIRRPKDVKPRDEEDKEPEAGGEAEEES